MASLEAESDEAGDQTEQVTAVEDGGNDDTEQPEKVDAKKELAENVDNQTEEDETELRYYEELFKHRYTEEDEKFTSVVNRPQSDPPIVDNWSSRPKRNFDWSRNRDESGSAYHGGRGSWNRDHNRGGRSGGGHWNRDQNRDKGNWNRDHDRDRGGRERGNWNHERNRDGGGRDQGGYKRNYDDGSRGYDQDSKRYRGDGYNQGGGGNQYEHRDRNTHYDGQRDNRNRSYQNNPR